MKKHLILSLGLVLTSPLLLAQNSGDKDDDRNQRSAQPATPAVPAVPGGSSSSPAVEGPTTNDEGDTSGSARSGQNSAGATGNPNTKSAKTRTRSGQGSSDFGALDSNGDNKLSQDEVKVNVELGAKFPQGDTNSDGSLSRGEFAKLQGSRSGDTGRDSEGRDKAKQEQTEGSDRTDKDDDLNRRLPGQ